jgi:copper chaperone NosL
MDPKFGAEIITKKGKIFKFDDAHCVVSFLNSGKVKQEDVRKTVFIDYENQENFLDAASTSFVISSKLKSPMNSNAGAFANKEKAQLVANETGGAVKTWNEVMGSTTPERSERTPLEDPAEKHNH